MQSYKYTARTASGQETTGLIEAFDEMEATAKIRSQYDIVVSIKEIKGSSKEGGGGLLAMELGGAKLDPKAFTMMCSQFATILTAGIPIARAVKLIGDKTADKKIKSILQKVGEDVEAGRTLSASFEAHGGKLLPATFVETIRAGEESGSMADSFQSVYEHFDKQTKMSGKVRGAMMYPMFVLVIAIVVVIVIMVKVVPTFTSMFDDLGGELPVMTQILIGVSGFFQKGWLYIVLAVVIAVIAFLLYKRTPQGGMNLAKMQLRLPILGNIAELNAASLFANTMATMIGTGLPMTKAVTITGNVMTNAYIKDRVLNMVTRLEEGRTVVDSMRESEVFPDILTDMVGVGEETGEMKSTLDVVAAYYDNELNTAVNAAVAAIEPALLIFIAFIAGFIVLSVYGTMFSMYDLM